MEQLKNKKLSVKQAYIANLGSALTIIFQLAQNSRHKDNFKKTIRAMSIWGSYPWRRLDLVQQQVSTFKLSLRLFSVPFNAIHGVFYFIFKFMQYCSYRKLRQLDYSTKEVGMFSPSFHLSEFSDHSHVGFWGEIKFLHTIFSVKTAWFLIPYKQPKFSHRQMSKMVSRINQETEFDLIPLAAYFGFGVLVKAIFEFIVFHAFVMKILMREIIFRTNHVSAWVLHSINLGKSLSKTELNRHLIASIFARENELKNCFHLMEGQSWEIALNHLSINSNFRCWGVIHTPLRWEDSQILNYFLKIEGKSLAEDMKGICCPGKLSSHYLQELGLSSSSLRLVEAQRFIHSRELGKFNYCRNSRRILYVSDANLETTKAFSDLARHEIGQKSNPDIEFFIQPHPSQVNIGFFGLHKVNYSEEREFGIVVFGPETSSFLQPEFSESNIRIFTPISTPNQVPLGAEAMIPRLEMLSNIEQHIKNPFILNPADDSIILKDAYFKKWRKIINEIL